MTGGLIQLVAYGTEDLYLVNEPQITFFKVVYRRHTNFSTEEIKQSFSHNLDFGRRVTVTLSRDGDLIRQITLVIQLPSIPQFLDSDGNVDNITKIAWVRRIGYAIIKDIEIEIGGELIDRQYGDFLNIWHDLTLTANRNINALIGDVDTLTTFTNGKQGYILYIPLQFWFNRITGLALPIVSLQYSHININVELNDIQSCYILSPTHIIQLDNDFVNYTDFEFLEQTVNGITSLARFIYFDIINKELYILRLSNNGFQSVTFSGNVNNPRTILYSGSSLTPTLVNEQYFINGLTSGFQGMPNLNAVESIYNNNNINVNSVLSTLSLTDAYLLVEYIYLDTEERVRFSKSKLEYLIEQVSYNGEKVISGINQSFKVGFTQPCKELIWVTQLSITTNPRVNDIFNYTNSLIRDNNEDLVGSNIVLNETILFNGQQRLTLRDSDYFTYIQQYQNHTNGTNSVINTYSFALYPEKHQPSGTANFSKIDNITLQLNVMPIITFNNSAVVRIYGIFYNILRVAHGISGLVFAIDTNIIY